MKKTKITSGCGGGELDLKNYCVFAAYHGDNISWHNKEYLKFLREAGWNVIYVHNGFLSNSTKLFLLQHVQILIERHNYGQDMGMYKQGVLYLAKENKLADSRLLLLNDSIFPVTRYNFTKELLGRLKEYTIVALNESYDDGYYLQSFCIGFRLDNIQLITKFIDFWLSYKPVPSRRYAINIGEKGITKNIINSVEKNKIFVKYSIKKELDSKTNKDNLFYSYSHAHLFWTVFVKTKDAASTIKRDIVKRGFVTINEVEAYLKEAKSPFIKQILSSLTPIK